MQQTQTDMLGRATFHHIAPQRNVRPTEREIRWLKHIERHGPQSSQYLYALTRDTHRCKDTTLRQIQKLRAGGFLKLPRQQRATERAEFNPYIYDLTKKSNDHLYDLGIAEPTVRPTGHWWHGYMTSCVTSSIDIAAARDGVRYIPAHEVLAIKGAPLAIPVGRSKLIPDQLFALDYGGSFRTFALEVDRGTEPKASPARRKSWVSTITQYNDVLSRNIHKSHYGLNSNLLVLWVFMSKTDEEKFLSKVHQHMGSVGLSVLTQTILQSKIRLGATDLLLDLYARGWNRADGSVVSIAHS